MQVPLLVEMLGRVVIRGEGAVNRIIIRVKFSGRLPSATQGERIALSECLPRSGGNYGVIFGRQVAKSIAHAVSRAMIETLIDAARFAKNLCLIHENIDEFSVNRGSLPEDAQLPGLCFKR